MEARKAGDLEGMECSCNSLQTRSPWGGWRTKLGQEIHCIFCVNARARGAVAMDQFLISAFSTRRCYTTCRRQAEPAAFVAACVLLIIHAS